LNRFEKIFFLSIILIEFGLVLILNHQLNQCKKRSYIDRPIETVDRFKILSTFEGKTSENKKEWVHFTPYSMKFYLFGIVSQSCHNCNVFIENWNTFFKNNQTEAEIEPILITEEPLKDFKYEFITHCLEISMDDIIQFGYDRPSLFVTNGRGLILFSHAGYTNGLFEEAIRVIHQNKNKKSRRL